MVVCEYKVLLCILYIQLLNNIKEILSIWWCVGDKMLLCILYIQLLNNIKEILSIWWCVGVRVLLCILLVFFGKSGFLVKMFRDMRMLEKFVTWHGGGLCFWKRSKLRWMRKQKGPCLYLEVC